MDMMEEAAEPSASGPNWGLLDGGDGVVAAGEPPKPTAAPEHVVDPEVVLSLSTDDSEPSISEMEPEHAPMLADEKLEVEESIPVKIAPAETTPKRDGSHQGRLPRRRGSNACYLWIVAVLVIITTVVLAVVLTRTETTSEPPPDVDPPVTMDFSTGVSLVTSYAIDTRVRSRLARTTVSMEVANALDCSSIHAISLQLPLNTRIVSLTTTSNDGCTSTGTVQEIGEARETFLDSAVNGLPGAYVEQAQDSFSHSLQVSIPPLGVTNVELVLEQLLQQRLGEVTFEVPLAPNEKVDSVVFDLTVEDTVGQPVEFMVDVLPGVLEASAEDGNLTSGMASASQPIHLDIPDARQYDLPQVIRGRYNPGPLPENGLLSTDGRCFEHFFRPASTKSMPRNFHFVLDTSESMNRNSKLAESKRALTAFIDTLSPEDEFTIQSFGNKGTEEMWGSGKATDDEKEDAKKFVTDLRATSRKTDLHEALLLALLRAKKDAETSDGNAATILVLLSDGHATRGETNRTKIAEHVYELNEEGTVKIFSLGFQGSADTQLLDAIALMNGGVSAPLLQGQDDFASQITTFLNSEIGNILMSDVHVEYSTGGPSEQGNVFGETQTTFPVLADGYEVVVRGLIGDTGGKELRLNAITSASTMDGPKSWELLATPAIAVEDSAKSTLCFQSYAHDRITQLLRLYDASDFLGDDLVRRLVTLSGKEECTGDKFSKCVRAEALAIATEANVVAKGLTAMVTVDDDKCMKLDEEAEVCLDGTTPDGGAPSRDNDNDYYSQDHGSPTLYSEGDEMYVSGESVVSTVESASYDAHDYIATSSVVGSRGYYSRASATSRGWTSLLVAVSSWFFVVVLKI